MTKRPRDVTDAELAILQVLWSQGPSTIRQLTDILYPERTAAQYATVQKLLQRLETKTCVKRDRSAAVHVFDATISRDDLIDRKLRTVAEKLCDGSLTPLLTHLVQADRLTVEERKMLRELVERLDRESGHSDSSL